MDNKEMFLDEIVVILRNMERTLERIEQTADHHAYLSMPFWRRWRADWTAAKLALQAQDDEGYPLGHNPQETEARP